jgi:glycosyltransferase involved in cell wall biosynthesis
VRLAAERREQRVELADAPNGRDDKIESHDRTLTRVPLVSVLMSVRNDARFLRDALDSVLQQTLADLELIVVDDASTDDTRELLGALDDPRVVLLRNEQQLGLAVSLNRALGAATGKYVARLDADDVAERDRLRLQVERLRADSQTAVVGSAVADLDEDGRRGGTHVMPRGPTALRWHALFSSPFFHPTVLVDREVLETHDLRYDPRFLESEDYDLWTRLFAFADGDNLRDALVLKRVHAGQASQRRREVQESFQREVALREIRGITADVDAELAWRVGARKPRGSRKEFARLLVAFERRYGRDWAVRYAALRALAA